METAHWLNFLFACFEKLGVQNRVHNRGTVEGHPVGSPGKPLDPQLSAHLERMRTILGEWTEPILVAYGTYARHPEQPVNFEKLLKICCEAAQHLAHAGGSAIALLDGVKFIYRMNAGQVVPKIGLYVASESGFPGACIKSRQAFLSNHVSIDQRVDPAVRHLGIRSLIVVPMVENGEVLGFLGVFSLSQNPFTVKHVISVQFIATLLGGVLSGLRQAKRDQTGPDSRPCPQEPSIANQSEHPPHSSLSSVPRLAARTETSKVIPSVSRIVAPEQRTAAPPEGRDPQPAQPSDFSSQSLPTTVKPEKANEPPREVESGSPVSATERRSRTRTLVDCLAYVSLGEENGGILLDINDAGFCMQIALPLDPGAPRQRRARLTGNGDLEADCELVWGQAGQAGFRFSNLSAEFCLKSQSWMTANGITALAAAGDVPALQRTKTANSALAKLDELHSMLLNSKLTTGGE